MSRMGILDVGNSRCRFVLLYLSGGLGWNKLAAVSVNKNNLVWVDGGGNMAHETPRGFPADFPDR